MHIEFGTWNINGNNGTKPKTWEGLREVLENWGLDLLAVQEVHATPESRDLVRANLAEIGLTHVSFGHPGRTAKHSVAIASRWPLIINVFDFGDFSSALLACTVESPEGEFVVVSVHAPNGSNNGWRKVACLERLAEFIHAVELPVVVAGDFNEPKAILEDGTVIPFTMKQDKKIGEWYCRGIHKGEPRQRWVTAVRGLIGNPPDSLLRHASRVRFGPAAFFPTHTVKNGGAKRYFDHVLVSPHWRVHQIDLDGPAPSDHAFVISSLELLQGAPDNDEDVVSQWMATAEKARSSGWPATIELGGEEDGVVLELQEHCGVINLRTIEWYGHEPVPSLEWFGCFRHEYIPEALRWANYQQQQRWANCRFCEQRFRDAFMFADDICMGCASTELGILF